VTIDEVGDPERVSHRADCIEPRDLPGKAPRVSGLSIRYARTETGATSVEQLIAYSAIAMTVVLDAVITVPTRIFSLRKPGLR